MSLEDDDLSPEEVEMVLEAIEDGRFAEELRQAYLRGELAECPHARWEVHWRDDDDPMSIYVTCTECGLVDEMWKETE